ncbi:hypothetical protein EXIGLDRAFT_753597 [Exidia glandulosa HHB12029]|uniref:Uncharacterized protein n=1 Tax=Exidia glandulosa HHB12029 TaxID=1314781 RepID=A0A165DMG9_EXIGL|nr:hypothetical protein EXIGLDRAFT_753597 [Exidia glandulosa HHB12029]
MPLPSHLIFSVFHARPYLRPCKNFSLKTFTRPTSRAQDASHSSAPSAATSSIPHCARTLHQPPGQIGDVVLDPVTQNDAGSCQHRAACSPPIRGFDPATRAFTHALAVALFTHAETGARNAKLPVLWALCEYYSLLECNCFSNRWWSVRSAHEVQYRACSMAGSPPSQAASAALLAREAPEQRDFPQMFHPRLYAFENLFMALGSYLFFPRHLYSGMPYDYAYFSAENVDMLEEAAYDGYAEPAPCYEEDVRALAEDGNIRPNVDDTSPVAGRQPSNNDVYQQDLHLDLWTPHALRLMVWKDKEMHADTQRDGRMRHGHRAVVNGHGSDVRPVQVALALAEDAAPALVERAARGHRGTGEVRRKERETRGDAGGGIGAASVRDSKRT